MIQEFKNFGYFINEVTTPQSVLDEIKNRESMIDVGENVDGHVDGTFRLSTSLKDLEALVVPYFLDYDKRFNFFKHIIPSIGYAELKADLVMNDAWVSFQNKYEFNPSHTHPGLLSFVIWLDIPYDRPSEIEHSPGKSRSNKSGSFTLYYTNTLGSVETLDILLDPTFNNKMITFPAGLKHSVQPFYSTDRQRVSIAGNLHIQGKE